MAKEVGAIRTKYVNVNLLFLKQVINISILASLGNLREPVSFFLRRLNRINWLQYSADSVLWSLCWDYTSEVTLKNVSIKKDEFGPSQELNKELWIVICLSAMSRQIEIEEPMPKDGFNLLDLQKFFLWIQNLCDQ